MSLVVTVQRGPQVTVQVGEEAVSHHFAKRDLLANNGVFNAEVFPADAEVDFLLVTAAHTEKGRGGPPAFRASFQKTATSQAAAVGVAAQGYLLLPNRGVVEKVAGRDSRVVVVTNTSGGPINVEVLAIVLEAPSPGGETPVGGEPPQV